MAYTNITDARGEKCRQSSSCTSGENVSALFAHKAERHEKLLKGMFKIGRGFEYVRNKVPNVSDAKIKIKEGICIGPQIRELMQDKQIDEDLNETERNAWLSFKRICNDSL